MGVVKHDATQPWPLEAGTVQTIVTSPPYWGLRDYGVDGQLGLERTPEEYVAKMVRVFREARRVLRDDGTLWLNLGDSYAGSGMTGGTNSKEGSARRAGRVFHGNRREGSMMPAGLKQKDLIGIPWRVAFALQADGWYLRSDIIWAKPNPIPESVTDRPTKAHEYLFLLAKSGRYYYDAEAISEPSEYAGQQAGICRGTKRRAYAMGRKPSGNEVVGADWTQPDTRNRRTVWTVTTQPFSEAHFATFPPALIEPCIKAGSKEGDLVVDPFCGSGTTGMVSLRLNRRFTGFDISDQYIEMATRRIEEDAPLFNRGSL